MTANLLLDCDMSPARPRCFNRAPSADSYTRHGIDQETGEAITVTLNRWFVDKCATWDGVGIGATPETARYPQAHGFNCTGCRWLPKEFA